MDDDELAMIAGKAGLPPDWNTEEGRARMDAESEVASARVIAVTSVERHFLIQLAKELIDNGTIQKESFVSRLQKGKVKGDATEALIEAIQKERQALNDALDAPD